jgi:hypothetical protein
MRSGERLMKDVNDFARGHLVPRAYDATKDRRVRNFHALRGIRRTSGRQIHRRYAELRVRTGLVWLRWREEQSATKRP